MLQTTIDQSEALDLNKEDNYRYRMTFHNGLLKWQYFTEPRLGILMQVANEWWFNK